MSARAEELKSPVLPVIPYMIRWSCSVSGINWLKNDSKSTSWASISFLNLPFHHQVMESMVVVKEDDVDSKGNRINGRCEPKVRDDGDTYKFVCFSV